MQKYALTFSIILLCATSGCSVGFKDYMQDKPTVNADNSTETTDTENNTNNTPDTEAPSAPQNFKAQAVSSSQINLSWDAATDNTGVTGYKIFRDGSEIATTADTSYSDTGLSALTVYTYTVLAYDAAGNESGYSPEARTTTYTIDGYPVTQLEDGTIDGPMEIVQDPKASGGSYIQSTVREEGTITFDMSIHTDGVHKIMARVYAASGDSNSFHYRIDDKTEYQCNIPEPHLVWKEYELGIGSRSYFIFLNTGGHSLTIRGREEYTRIDYIYLKRVGEFMVQDSTGTISAPMEVKNDMQFTLDGSYIQTNATNSGTAEFAFSITDAADYTIIGRVYAPDTSSNSFYVTIDSEPEIYWEISPTVLNDPVGTYWFDVAVNSSGSPYSVYLTAGEHTIMFRGAEPGTKLDCFYVQKVE